MTVVDGRGDGRRPSSARPGSRRVVRRVASILVTLAVVAWSLVAWEGLVPPVPIPVPGVDTADMVYCEGGLLVVSIPPAAARIEPFLIDRFEVTRQDYAEFLAANPGYPVLPDPAWGGLRHPPPGTEDLPVTYVSIDDARAFARWRGKRLPTTTEWEWAARGASGQRYPWGDREPAGTIANTVEAGFGRPTPVGLFESGRSPCGAYDMVGNVNEWTDTPAPGLASDRFFVRGGSFNDPILDFDRKTTILDTHRWAETGRGADGGEWVPRPERLHGATSNAWDRGFRCVRAADEVERERTIETLVTRLGARDPVRWTRETWPAQRELQRIGAPALGTLRHAADGVEHAGVRARLRGLIETIEGR